MTGPTPSWEQSLADIAKSLRKDGDVVDAVDSLRPANQGLRDQDQQRLDDYRASQHALEGPIDDYERQLPSAVSPPPQLILGEPYLHVNGHGTGMKLSLLNCQWTSASHVHFTSSSGGRSSAALVDCVTEGLDKITIELPSDADSGPVYLTDAAVYRAGAIVPVSQVRSSTDYHKYT